jgi:fatty-acyl-CoA synthase
MFGVNYFASGGPRYPADNDDLLSMLRNNECYTEAVVAPMMHGLGVYSVLCTLSFGGTVVTSSAPRFSAQGLLRAVADHGVNVFKIPGDAMGKPLLEALDADPMTGQLDTLRMIISSAAVFSAHIKRGLVERVPHLLINDILGGSESAALGNAISSAASQAGNATDAALRLQTADCVKVFTPELKEVVPGSGERGMVARSGLIAEGYFKDPVKTAATFPVIDGERYCLLGDWAEVLADGSIKFLGRGNVCINTGGEKVFPEEVEQVLKALDSVDDCGVVGVDDARWGSAVTALLSLKAGHAFDLQAICLQLRECLADYKVPRHFVLVDDVSRGPNGKLDYRRLSARAAAALDSNPDSLKVFSR